MLYLAIYTTVYHLSCLQVCQVLLCNKANKTSLIVQLLHENFFLVSAHYMVKQFIYMIYDTDRDKQIA